MMAMGPNRRSKVDRHTSRTRVALLKWLLVVLALAGLLASTASATIDHARQTGQPCAACHVRPEGGGELDLQGLAYARGGYRWPIPAGVQAAPPSNLVRTLKLIMGYIHLIVTVIWLGAIFYIHLLVRPRQLTAGVPKGEGTVGWIGIGTIALTGIVLTILRYLETGSVFAGAFGRVFIIKLGLFGVVVLLAAVATAVLTPRIRQASRSPAAYASAASEGASLGEGSSGGEVPSPITPNTLPALDGHEGTRAVVAVDGKLYDVTASRMWREGVHVKRHRAGQDLTEALKGAPHGPEVLERVSLIGELQAPPGRVAPREPRAKRVFVAFTYANLALTLGILLCVAWWQWGFTWDGGAPPQDVPTLASLSEASARCMECHTDNGFLGSQISQWRSSTHAREQVGCFECHHADPGDPDAMQHNGFTVSVLVTPKDCAACHIREVEQFAASRHSQGGDILDSLDNILGERVEGVAAAVSGCQQCHGAPVQVLEGGKLSAASWPNTGIGRINPDGSRGACSTCHTRHSFSVAVAREPASCGHCHMGPDHPQKEIYEESKHGIAFTAHHDEMNLEARPWVLGEDYTAAPTCATCHMSAVPGLAADHDVGLRIAWTLRPAVSTRLENWEERRASMRQVCRQCHSPGFEENFFAQFDDVVDLYNDKFARPAMQIVQRLREAGKLTATDFDEQIEWTYFYLWHHEGRRARHGASMMGPDYVQWHGFYEVADRFYNEFLPEAEELLPGVTEPFLQQPEHQWRAAQSQ